MERGVEATVSERTSEELAVLEAAARYQKRPDVARRALLAQRARFAGSPRAKEAAFLLGRMAEGADGPAALGWYERMSLGGLRRSVRGRGPGARHDRDPSYFQDLESGASFLRRCI